jgi:hypothetical protein
MAWRVPAFVVTLWSGERKLVDRRVDRGRQAARRPAACGGRYELMIDAGGLEADATVEAVDVGPTLPGELSDIRTAIVRPWLAQQDAGRWRLDSLSGCVH